MVMLIYVCLNCVNSRWSASVVGVGAPQNIFKLHSQISRLGMWTSAFIYQRIILLDYSSRTFYDYVVNCISSKII